MVIIRTILTLQKSFVFAQNPDEILMFCSNCIESTWNLWV